MKRRLINLALVSLAVAGSAWSCAEATTPSQHYREQHGTVSSMGPVSDHANRKTEEFGNQFWHAR